MSGTHAPIAPSSLALYVACAAALRLGEPYQNLPDTPEQIEGTAAHWVNAQDVAPVLGTMTPMGVPVTEDMLYGRLLWERTVGLYGHVETPVQIPRIHPTLCWGTPDWWDYQPIAECLRVWDYKYGHLFVDVFECWQLIAYALGLVDFLGLSDDTWIELGRPPLLAGTLAPSLSAAGTRSEVEVRFSLSARLLSLTVAFVMLIEVLIFAPSVAQFRVSYIRAKLSQAHLILSALDASRGTIDPTLRDAFLDDADMPSMTLYRPDQPPQTLTTQVPPVVIYHYDLRDTPLWQLIADAFAVLGRTGDPIFNVIDESADDSDVTIEAVLEEEPLRKALHDYAIHIFALSVFSSMTTAALVYASLQWLAVRPLRRITASMIAFREAPEDQTRVIVPDKRQDEVGVAERALADMQDELRQSLSQRERLAAVGTAVTKVSHDLKNLLATAILESDRLAASGGEETRRITAGIVRALERAVALSKSTLKFAQEGLPTVRRRRQALAPVINEVAATLGPALPDCTIAVDIDPATHAAIDADLLHRALENLVRNAAEAGAHTVQIAWQAGAKPALAIIDDGRGLPPRARANLFVPFAGSARVGGSGLGLPIARECLRVQGGDVLLGKSSGQGTTFLIRLPA